LRIRDSAVDQGAANDDNRIGLSGLPPQRVEGLLDDIGVAKGVMWARTRIGSNQ
jgi:hypothetical protein